MKRLPVTLLLALLLVLPSVATASDSLVVASGAGYRKMVDALAAAYEAQAGPSVDRLYGNMAQTLAQAKSGGVVDLVLGARYFLDKSGIAFVDIRSLGRGRLVVACARGLSFSSAKDLLDPSVQRIAIPDTKRAIYGRAAMEYLQGTGLYDQLQDKLIMVATIPQVASYVVTGEVDMGFVNSTHVLAIQDKIGGWGPAEEDKYEAIDIVAGVTPDAPHQDKLRPFLDFLGTDKAKSIIVSFGL